MRLTRNLTGLALIASMAFGGDAGDLAKHVTFHASFDRDTDADFAKGDRRIHTRLDDRARTVKPGLERTDVVRAPGGRFGDCLQFKDNSRKVVLFKGENNFAWKPKDWSGAISFWMSLDPETDLKPGFSDPIQFTDRQWDDAAFFVDFTKDDKPRHFRMGIYADRKVWNPSGKNFDTMPKAEKPFSEELTKPPFAKDRWTHVVVSFERFNTGKPDGHATLYLDAKPSGEITGRSQTFTWTPAKVELMLGLSYIGRLDELTLFDRALTAAEVEKLYRLEKGVGPLLAR